MTVPIIIPFYVKRNIFVLFCSLVRTTDDMENPWYLSFYW